MYHGSIVQLNDERRMANVLQSPRQPHPMTCYRLETDVIDYMHIKYQKSLLQDVGAILLGSTGCVWGIAALKKMKRNLICRPYLVTLTVSQLLEVLMRNFDTCLIDRRPALIWKPVRMRLGDQ